MSKHLSILGLLIAAITGGVLLLSAPLRAADPVQLLCPNGQTVFLQGLAAPRESLVLFLDERAVGGGFSRNDGSFSIPLRPSERPGIYPVEVRLRSNSAVVASFTCFVDVSLETTLTPADPTSGASPVATPRGIATVVTATPARQTPTPATTTPTGSVTAGTATVTTTTTLTTTVTATTTVTTTATVTATTVAAAGIQISEVVRRDPAFPEDEDEYVTIENNGTTSVNIAGWRLINATRAGQVPAYVFPSFPFGTDVTIAVYSRVGDDDPDIGDFFWDQPDDVWNVGDRVELRDTQNRVISTFTVANQ